jgi:mRNA interferase MazF
VVRRSEVRWGETPKHGRRPYLILTRNPAIGVLSEILVAPLTKAIRAIPTHVPLDESDGLPEPCAVTLDNLVMIPTGYLGELIATLEPQRMSEVCSALAASVDCG